MSDARNVGLAVLGLVGLYLLSGRGGENSGGGFGGVGGTDREAGDTVINFPELDLSDIWGGNEGFTPAQTKKEATQAGLDSWAESQLWYENLAVGGPSIGDWFRAQSEGAVSRSNTLNPQAMPYSIHDTTKKASAHHGPSILPDPVSLGFKPLNSSGGSTSIPSYVYQTPSPVKPVTKKVSTRDYGYGVSQYGGY